MTKSSILISYSHKDEGWKNRLVSQLRVLELEDYFDIWDDSRIGAGEEWRQKIEMAAASLHTRLSSVKAHLPTSSGEGAGRILHTSQRILREEFMSRWMRVVFPTPSGP